MTRSSSVYGVTKTGSASLRAALDVVGMGRKPQADRVIKPLAKVVERQPAVLPRVTPRQKKPRVAAFSHRGWAPGLSKVVDSPVGGSQFGAPRRLLCWNWMIRTFVRRGTKLRRW